MFALATTRTSAYPKRLLRTANQSLAKHNRKPSQAIENNHQQPKSIASFCRVFSDYQGKGAHPAERDDHCTRLQILIASAPELKTDANA